MMLALVFEGMLQLLLLLTVMTASCFPHILRVMLFVFTRHATTAWLESHCLEPE